MVYLCSKQINMGDILDIFANTAFFNAMSFCSLMRLASLARLNSKPVAVLQELSSTVLCVCHRKPHKSRLAPPRLAPGEGEGHMGMIRISTV